MSTELEIFEAMAYEGAKEILGVQEMNTFPQIMEDILEELKWQWATTYEDRLNELLEEDFGPDTYFDGEKDARIHTWDGEDEIEVDQSEFTVYFEKAQRIMENTTWSLRQIQVRHRN